MRDEQKADTESKLYVSEIKIKTLVLEMKAIDQKVQGLKDAKVDQEQAKKDLNVCVSRLDGFEEQALQSEEIKADDDRQGNANTGKLAEKHRKAYNDAKAKCDAFEVVAFCKVPTAAADTERRLQAVDL